MMHIVVHTFPCTPVWPSQIPPGQTYKSPGEAYVEGDASSASYFLAGATITGQCSSFVSSKECRSWLASNQQQQPKNLSVVVCFIGRPLQLAQAQVYKASSLAPGPDAGYLWPLTRPVLILNSP
jgi:hypothetical protein